MFFSYDNLKFRYDPFPIGFAKPLMDEGVYQELVGNWPDTRLFKAMPELGKKFALSQKFHAKQYREFIRSVPVWREFHAWIKSDDFVYGIMDALRANNIDLGYERLPRMKRLRKRIKNFGRGQFSSRVPRLRARFEYQMMPADGGHILPHTDTPQKIVTLVVSMMREGEWDPAFGGGTELDRPKDITQNFNYLNRYSTFEEMEEIDTFDFTPNQMVVFVKTFNSWHCVRPMTGVGSSAMRKTLIINIEKPKSVML
jgi:hypothetical protein